MTDNKKQRKIILIDGANAPQFDGQWTIGEVLAMAEALARWAQSLQVPVVSNAPD